MAARLFAVRLAASGIPVYEVRPGIVHTDMTANVAQWVGVSTTISPVTHTADVAVNSAS